MGNSESTVSPRQARHAHPFRSKHDSAHEKYMAQPRAAHRPNVRPRTASVASRTVVIPHREQNLIESAVAVGEMQAKFSDVIRVTAPSGARYNATLPPTRSGASQPWVAQHEPRRSSAPASIESKKLAVDILQQFSNVPSLLNLRNVLLETSRTIVAFDDTGSIICMSNSCKKLLKPAIKSRSTAARKYQLNFEHIILPASMLTLAEALSFLNEKKPLDSATIYIMSIRGQHLHMRIRCLYLDEQQYDVDDDEERVFFVASMRLATPEESTRRPQTNTMMAPNNTGLKKTGSRFIANLMKLSKSMRLQKQEQHKEEELAGKSTPPNAQQIRKPALVVGFSDAPEYKYWD